MAQLFVAYQAAPLPTKIFILTGISPENFRNIEPELFKLGDFISIVMC